ncbi:hypothetical protein T12_535 [Trichinella patagoniensis]|uniref:Uncharacterized protein n=1 Tax=Trichinella patagoniensis TaxID=990121 RepID=A0A0V0Z470_9BILA|nr:hypothetical protein T12_535 [Trichinella patagoniensis]
MSSHEARTDANQCSPGVSMAFSSRPSVPLFITNSKKEFDIITAMKYVKCNEILVCRCTSQHFVLDSNGLRHQKISVVADGTLKLRFLRFFLLRKCVTVKTRTAS